MYEFVRGHERIRQARWSDFAVIDGWRSAHFAEMRRRQPAGERAREVVGQAEFATAAWAVYTDEQDVPLAAIGFRDEPQARRRLVTDLYSERSRSGLRAGEMLGRMVEAMSDRDGFEIRGSTDPENTDYLMHLLSRGYEVVAVEFRRRSRGIEQQCGGAEPSRAG